MKKIILFVLLLTLIALISIFSLKKYMKNRCEEISFTDIVNKEYAYVDSNGNTTNLTVVFSDDGRVFGFSGVNKYFAGYKLDENQVVISPIGTTMNTASDEEMNSEKQFIEMLNNISAVRACKNKLLLKENEKTLKFVPTGKEVTEVITNVENTNENTEAKSAETNNEAETVNSSATEQQNTEANTENSVETNNVPVETNDSAPLAETNN